MVNVDKLVRCKKYRNLQLRKWLIRTGNLLKAILRSNKFTFLVSLKHKVTFANVQTELAVGKSHVLDAFMLASARK